MPELPEVETIRRQLEPELVGRRITAVEILDERWTEPSSPADVVKAVTGRQIVSVQRRGKYLLVGLKDDVWLAMHLRMTGSLLLASPDSNESSPGTRHLRAELTLDDGSSLLFTDPRRFGRALALDGPALEAYLDARLGIEPLTDALTAEAIGQLTVGRRAPLKSFLLAQGGIAGIGNIYADEALYRAELHPLSPAGSTRPEHWEALREGIVDALETALDNGGASIDDYRDARGEPGTMQDEFLVHAREGEPCPNCNELVRRIVVSGRSTYFCRACQTRLRKRRARVSR